MFRKLFATFSDKGLEDAWHELNRRIESAVAASSGSASIVYREGAQSSGNVYGTWPETAAAAAAVQGLKVVYVDDSLGQPQVTAGTWDLGGYAVLVGRQRGIPSGTCTLVCRNGARLLNVFQFRALAVQSESSSPVIESRDVQGAAAAGTPTWVLAEGASIECKSTAAFFIVNSGAQTAFSAWWLADDSKLIEPASQPPQGVLVAQSRNTVLQVYLKDNALAEDNTVAGLPNTIAYVEVTNAGATCLSQPTATIVLAEQAARVFFQASASPHLGATEVQAAIDALAYRLRWGAGSPEGVVTAPPGVLYLDTNGGKTLYVKESGVGNTGWVFK